MNTLELNRPIHKRMEQLARRDKVLTDQLHNMDGWDADIWNELKLIAREMKAGEELLERNRQDNR